MPFNLSNFIGLLRLSFVNPRQGARAVIDLPLPASARWIALALVAIVAAIVAQVVVIAMPSPPNVDVMAPSPLQTAGVQLVVMALCGVLMHFAGRIFGGQGRLDEAVVLLAWLQLILLILQVVQIALLFLIPPLSGFLAAGSVALFFWFLTYFTAELHGFRSTFKTFCGVIGIFAVAVTLLSFLIAPFLIM